jgi:hypothetical protein
MGRPITGMQITPFIGIIPNTPGLQFSMSYLHYDGEIGGSREAPIAGREALNLSADVELFAATFAYIWNTGEGRWNFASMLTIPVISQDIAADLQVGNLQARTKDSSSGLFDLYFAPVIASYHVSEVEHWSMGVYIYAPTADYNKNNLANNGLNIWTISPAVGYTHLFNEGSLELSALAGVDFSTKNDDTDYKSGALFRLDALLIQSTPSGWGFGAVAGWIEQIEDDSGPTADRLDGFRGRSLGIGPLVSYSKHWSKEGGVFLTLRWLKEFDVKNRLEGDPLMLNVSLTF